MKGEIQRKISKQKGEEYHKIEESPSKESFCKFDKGLTLEIKTMNRIITNHYYVG